MSSENHIIVDFRDLNRVLVVCEKCQTELGLDASNAKSECPESCPSCRTKYSFGLSAAFDEFKNALHALAEKKAKVRIALKA